MPTATPTDPGDHPEGTRRHLRPLIHLAPPVVVPKKKAFPFGGLGCSSSAAAHVFTPSSAAAAVRSSAEWPPKKPRGRRKKPKGRTKDKLQTNCVVNPADVWCAVESSVDCVPPLYQRGTRAERPPREGVFGGRMGVVPDPLRLSSLLEDPQSPGELRVPTNDVNSRHVHRSRRIRQSPGGLDELMMFQARLLMGEMDVHDRYRDLRLDVDNMTYEELLELGERIGYVNTGLREEDIFCCLRKMKHSIFTVSALQFSSQLERKCSICQEDYELNDEVGKLDCGHGYHTCCIKQWLLRKNSCPVCKATVGKN